MFRLTLFILRNGRARLPLIEKIRKARERRPYEETVEILGRIERRAEELQELIGLYKLSLEIWELDRRIRKLK